MRELYALLVGEAGIDPRYFLHEMSPHEAADFLEGYRRRERGAWERARVGWYTNVRHNGKSVTDLFPFEWDKKEKAPRITKSQRDKLRLSAQVLAEKLNRENGK